MRWPLSVAVRWLVGTGILLLWVTLACLIADRVAGTWSFDGWEPRTIAVFAGGTALASVAAFALGLSLARSSSSAIGEIAAGAIALGLNWIVHGAAFIVETNGDVPLSLERIAIMGRFGASVHGWGLVLAAVVAGAAVHVAYRMDGRPEPGPLPNLPP